MIARRCLIFLALAVASTALPATAQADFGFAPGSTTMSAVNADGSPTTQAGSHPYAFSYSFALNTINEGGVTHTEGGSMRDLITDLPAGMIGNPRAVPTCARPTFEGGRCDGSTQVGVLHATLPGVGEAIGPLYNLNPPPGVAAQIGFSTLGLTLLGSASLRSEEGYGVRVFAPNLPIEAREATVFVWGTPADPGHDGERTCITAVGGQYIGCPSSGVRRPFLTLPTSCGAPPQLTLRADSVFAPGAYAEETASFLDSGGNPTSLSGCESVPFAPSISAQPTTRLASNPSGLDFELKLPNQGLLSAGIAETEPRKTVVTLPRGVTINPSLAEGVGVCTEDQYKAEKIDSPAGAGCPKASKLGSVIAQSPLLEEPVEGAVYLAAPYENPFGTLAALYLVARAPERGVLVKQAGKVEFGQSTGQITTSFEGLPPVPYSSFKLHFREGARAPLATPQSCGEYVTTARFTPFSAKDDTEVIEKTASFQIERGAEGGPCPTGGLPPFRPALTAGTINNAAGHFSPFNLRLSRTDSEQEITHFSIKLPPGITGKLAGIPYCSDAAIAAATARTGPHGGREELEHPSCPAASEVGRTLAGAGVGPSLAYAPGKVYLAGPYHGSNLSIVAITAGVVGPFDIGTVVIRQALRIDPETAEVFIDSTGSDPLPHIIKGIPVHLRDIRAYVDKPEFVLNPTDCTRTSTASTLLGSGLDFGSEADDRPVTVSTPFQAADCAALPFKPKLSLSLKGGTRRGGHPAFSARLKMNGIGEAGIARAEVTLPKSEFIDQSHFITICTRVQFKAGAGNGSQCPAGSVYGKATATTPILGEALTGPVFLRSSEHQLPDLVVALHNAQVDFDLVGHVDSVKGKLRNTFEAAPDAPVSSFVLEMQGGKKGLFENSTDLCASVHKAESAFTGQNGKRWDTKPVMRVKCAKGRKGK